MSDAKAVDPGGDSPGGRRRGRPRRVGADEDIMIAALTEYAERGWAGYTLDGVARRAGVGKSTLYLRWPDKQQLLAEAVRIQAAPLLEVDLGSVRADLEVLARGLLAYVLTPVGFASLRVAFDAAGSPEPLGNLVETTVHPHRYAAETILRRAVARGDLDADADIATAILALYGSVFSAMLALRPDERDPSEEELDRLTTPIVTFVLKALS